jgi:hypothetical protein
MRVHPGDIEGELQRGGQIRAVVVRRAIVRLGLRARKTGEVMAMDDGMHGGSFLVGLRDLRDSW